MSGGLSDGLRAERARPNRRRFCGRVVRRFSARLLFAAVAGYNARRSIATNRQLGHGVMIPMTAEQRVDSPPRPKLFREDRERVTRKDSSGNVIMEPGKSRMIYQELTSFDENPTFASADFEPSVPINEGVRVYMQDDRQRLYVWKKGEVAPAVRRIKTGDEFKQ